MTASEAIDWSAFAGGGGTFVKWDTIGARISGTVTNVAVGRDMNERPVPQIDLDTDDGPKTLTCSQAQLKAKIAAAKPKVGDTLTVVYTHDEPAAMGKKKCFDVTVTPATAGTASATPPF